VHEVAIARPELMAQPYIQRILAHHVTPQELSRPALDQGLWTARSLAENVGSQLISLCPRSVPDTWVTLSARTGWAVVPVYTSHRRSSLDRNP
jgi:hypothetical protein